jgi:type IV pilus assembly protein PilA
MDARQKRKQCARKYVPPQDRFFYPMASVKLSRTLRAAGFTLVELLTVCTVIGILAAIAIPQFQGYRARTMDAMALSDIKNLFNLQEGLFASAKSYGMTQQTPGGFTVFCPTNPNKIYVVGAVGGGLTCCPPFVNTPAGEPVGVSNGVVIAAKLGANGDYISVAKHGGGTVCFAMDSNAALIYRNEDQAKFAPGKSIGLAPAEDVLAGFTTNDANDNIQGQSGWSPQ